MSHFPEVSGVYKMLNAKGAVIYIGKAKNLKARVSSYFTGKHHDPKTTRMISQVCYIDFIATDSETEALILEKQCVKNDQPKYNILLKDDKHFPYIKITTALYPKVKIVRQRLNDGALYFGPYPALGSTRRLAHVLSELFLLRTCKQVITDTQIQPKCILLDMKKCLGPCVDKTIKADYHDQLKRLQLLLTGKHQQIRKPLQHEMKQFAANQRFESAARCRDMIAKIDQLAKRQTVDINDMHPIQVWVFVENEHYYYVLVQEIIRGQLLRQQGFQNKKTGSITSEDVCEQVLLEYHCMETPKEIFFDATTFPLSLENMVKSFPKSTLTHPKRGTKYKVLQRAHTNAILGLKRISVSLIEKPRSISPVLKLKQTLNLTRAPHRIWGIDISHLDGTNIVGSAICFMDGKPYKSLYRRFNIKTVAGKSDDVRSIYEVVTRRMQHAFEHHETMPDLILIDGGKGQLRFAMKALDELGMSHIVQILSLAKKEEEIFMPHHESPIRLSHSDAGLQLLQRVRDESHRFAITFQRHKRNTTFFNEK